MWSHGRAWLPKDGLNPNTKSQIYDLKLQSIFNGLPATKNYGQDINDEIDIRDLANAIPIKFDFLIFDACFMGSIEVAAEMQGRVMTFI